MNPLNSLEYRKAFNNYLRRGTPIRLSLKAEDLGHPTTHYIWRTREDALVRSSHVENNGKIFAWDNPPATGNPGEDYGCRCTAEPYERGESEYAYQTLTSDINDAPRQWTDTDFGIHYYLGHGEDLTLSETGHLAGVIDYFLYKLNVYDRINAQIIAIARRNSSGLFSYTFINSYDFGDYIYVFGRGVVSGEFSGTVKHENGMMFIEGDMTYVYTDTFTDPASVREKIFNGTSSVDASSPLWVAITDGGGQYFGVSDMWKTEFRSEAKYNESESTYQWLG